MTIAAEPSLPSGPLSAAGWSAISVAAALETSITASAIVASATIAIAVANNDNHPRKGHDVNDCPHDDGHNDMIIDDGLTLSHSPLVIRPVDHAGVDDDNDRQQDRQCGGGGAWRALIDGCGGIRDDWGK
jgi:hypothetical protein